MAGRSEKWKAGFKKAGWFFKTKRRRCITILLLVFAVLGTLGLKFLHYTSDPEFCISCHFMQPYYDSWKTSEHKDVSCVLCHYEPGWRATLKGKFVGIAQLAKYVTGTEGTRPAAEIADASCLRKGCHEKRLIENPEKPTIFKKNIKFDHKAHLTTLRRGKRLRCTSCHSQIVQGPHVTVTETSCFVCHFKDVEFNKDTAKCTGCHASPTKTYTIRGIDFDHKMVEVYKIACIKCHRNVVRGGGAVPKERCMVCHNRQGDLERYKETELIHDNHVSRHKVECLDCHLHIEHSVEKDPVISEIDCTACHPKHHDRQIALYSGAGARGVPAEATPMFLVRAGCKSCHDAHADSTEKGVVWRSGKEACTKCHSEKFAAKLDQWKSGLDDTQKEVVKLLDEVTALLDKADPRSKEYEKAKTLVGDAQFNYALVHVGKGVHNVAYSDSVLMAAEEMLEKAKKLLSPK